MSDQPQGSAAPYPLIAEIPIVEALSERNGWINVEPVAIATTALSALAAAGWRLIPPAGTAGYCDRCRGRIEPNTVHSPFLGNQMFACQITTVGSPDV